MAVHNRAETTRACIRAARSAAVNASVTLRWVIFDDGSSDSTPAVLLQEIPSESRLVLRGDGEQFWAASMREAMRALLVDDNFDSDFVLLLNDDTTLAVDAFDKLLPYATQNGIVAGITVDPRTTEPTYGGYVSAGRWRRLSLVPVYEPNAVVDTFNGNAVLVGSDAFKRLGPFAHFWRHGLADIDYGFMAGRKGIEVRLSVGPCGTCARNSPDDRWLAGGTLIDRWMRVRSPKGVPPGLWARYCLRNGGLSAPFYILNLYRRVLFPGIKRKQVR